jgi:F-type H+-transporting ATPase subunit epsilon
VARTKFHVEVLTPEGKVFDGEVEMVSTRTTTGSIGVLAHHMPLMGILEPTELRLYRGESDVEKYAQGEGYLQVVENRALVLVEEAIKPDDLDTSDIESRLRDAEQQLETADKDSEEYKRCERNVKRYKAFLEVGGSS